jgi:predicted phosphodiesterase
MSMTRKKPTAKKTSKETEKVSRKPLGQRIAEKESKVPQAERALMAERSKKYLPETSAEDMIQDLRRVQALDPARHITRNYYREHGKYSDQTWSTRFGTFQEFRRESGLELHRGGQRIEKATAIQASRDRYRGFFEVEIMPYVGKYDRQHKPGMKTVLVASDFHDKEVDRFALAVFLDTARRVQPDVIVLAGDVFDMYEFSRFDKDPRLTNLRERFDFVREEIFRPLREAAPKAQIDFIIGNHDVRILRHMADRSPYLAPLLDLMGVSLAQVFGLDKFQINLVAKGDFSAYQPREHREEISKNYKKYWNTLVVGHEPADYGMCSIAGHTHKPKFENKVNELVGGYFNLTLGCMARVDVDYIHGLNNYQNGFALIHIDPDRCEAVPEMVIFTDHYAMVGGMLYSRSK